MKQLSEPVALISPAMMPPAIPATARKVSIEASPEIILFAPMVDNKEFTMVKKLLAKI